MRRVLQGAVLAFVVLGVAVVWGDERARTESDEQFVFKACEAGLAEVNLGNLAVKQATNPDVKRFAQQMVTDHEKANNELIDLANRKKWKVAPNMDDRHQKFEERLLKLRGSEFDREYMHGQVQDHKEVVALFERQARSGKDADLKKWTEKTLPHLRDHLKMAQDIEGRLGGGAEKASKSGAEKK